MTYQFTHSVTSADLDNSTIKIGLSVLVNDQIVNTEELEIPYIIGELNSREQAELAVQAACKRLAQEHPEWNIE